MRKIGILLIAVLGFAALCASCSDSVSYADQKKQEKAAINSYITKQGIKVISEAEFFANDTTTDVSKNEYVLFNTSGVYMQIVRKGCGKKLANGETATVLCRFTERNLLTDTLQLTNMTASTSAYVEKMMVTNTSGTFSAAFGTETSLMYSAYSSTSVPSGWLVPLSYILIGRPSTADEEIARVNLIVPHSQGQSYASSSVYPCFYEITYQRGR